MSIYGKEMRKGIKSFLIWTIGIAALLVCCVMLYPEMETQMGDMSEMFSDMGVFTQAFGMDQLNFGTLIGFYGIECGNILGIGGGFFAAYLGVSMIAKEEKDHTAEFLLTHPISRKSVFGQKLFAVTTQIIILNVIVVISAIVSILFVGEDIPTKELMLIHGAYLIMQLELGWICFGISAFLKRSFVGVGFGLAGLMYVLNLMCNITDKVEALKYITPFAYTETATIVDKMALDWKLIVLGIGYSIIILVIGFIKYQKKDIAS